MILTKIHKFNQDNRLFLKIRVFNFNKIKIIKSINKLNNIKIIKKINKLNNFKIIKSIYKLNSFKNNKITKIIKIFNKIK